MTPMDIAHLLIDPELLERYGWRMLEGLGITARLVALSFILGAALGVLLAVARLSPNPLLRHAAGVYIYVLRGTPLLAQLFLLYYGLGSLREVWQEVGLWWLFRDAWYCAVLAFTLNTAAYQAEIFRASLQAIPAGQFEAAQALGLRRLPTFLKVTLPQSLMIAVGPLGNELILLIKASAIASLVTLYDLMGVAKLGFSRSFDFQIYLWAALLYLLVVELVRRAVKRLDARLSRHLR